MDINTDIPASTVLKGPKDDNDLLWLLACQIWDAGIWDDLFYGLNDKGKKDLFNFVRNILYVDPDNVG